MRRHILFKCELGTTDRSVVPPLTEPPSYVLLLHIKRSINGATPLDLMDNFVTESLNESVESSVTRVICSMSVLNCSTVRKF